MRKQRQDDSPNEQVTDLPDEPGAQPVDPAIAVPVYGCMDGFRPDMRQEKTKNQEHHEQGNGTLPDSVRIGQFLSRAYARRGLAIARGDHR